MYTARNSPYRPASLGPLRVTLLLCVLALIWGGCGGASSPSADGQVDSDVADAAGGGGGGVVILGGADVLAAVDTSGSEGDTISCEPGAYVCTSETGWAICHPQGHGYGVNHTCASTARCDPVAGVCLPIVCEPGTSECKDWQTVHTCNAVGTNFVVQEPCPDHGVCLDGACVPCWPGDPACQSLQMVGQCAADGSEILEDTLELCPDGEVCRASEGVCVVPVCEPESWRCVNPFVYQICDAIGSQWEASEACPDNFVCKETGCVYAPCVPTVLFLVDRSGSMDDKWSAVHASVSAIVSDNPEAIFGLSHFPSGASSESCSASPGLRVPFSFAGIDPFDAYFTTTTPEGLTPLVEAVEVISKYADSVFGAYKGSLVVLSDGGETCISEEIGVRLTDAVTELKVVHGVSTYVIGYNFSGDTYQLDVMAANGGTSFTSHIVAGDEASLIDAFQSVVNDIKLCVP
jgi:hypothetical protein